MRKILILILLLLIPISSYADSNGIWYYPEDIRSGVFGLDEGVNNSINSIYKFINPVMIDSNLSVQGFVTLNYPIKKSDGATKEYVDSKYNLSFNKVIECNKKGMLFNGEKCIYSAGADAIPDDFEFQNKTGVELDSYILSNEIQVKGFQGYIYVSLENATSLAYLLKNGEDVGTSTKIFEGDYLEIVMKSDDDYEKFDSVVYNVGLLQKTWSIQTRPEAEYVTISGTSYNLNLANYLGNPSEPTLVILTVTGSGKIGSSSVSTPALSTGNLPEGSQVIIKNNGIIAGHGGRGATDGGYPQAGGSAIYITTPTTIDNGGIIGSGGGGGGQGYYGSGGGGAGLNPGGSGGGNSRAGTLYTGGRYGDGSGKYGYGRGGSGGNLGAHGQSGSWDRQGSLSGASAGFSIIGVGLVTWENQGDLRGAMK